MATLLEKWTHRLPDSDLSKKVDSAILATAYVILGEDQGTANHAARVIWANQVRTDDTARAAQVPRGVMACLDNPSIGANPDAATDQDILFVINQIAGT